MEIIINKNRLLANTIYRNIVTHGIRIHSMLGCSIRGNSHLYKRWVLPRLASLCNHWRIQGGAAGAPPPPQQDPFLSFSHTFSPKSVHVGGRRPPPPPPTGNPGSATGNEQYDSLVASEIVTGNMTFLLYP